MYETNSLPYGSGECMGADAWRMYWVHWNTRKARLARKSLAESRPAAGRSWKPDFPDDITKHSKPDLSDKLTPATCMSLERLCEQNQYCAIVQNTCLFHSIYIYSNTIIAYVGLIFISIRQWPPHSHLWGRQTPLWAEGCGSRHSHIPSPAAAGPPGTVCRPG